jgi:hypothetical protein
MVLGLSLTNAIPSSGEKSSILCHLTWSNGLELNFQYFLATENLRRTALSYTDFPHRPAMSCMDYHTDHVRLQLIVTAT